ncbi:MAG TPA: 2OG-Fe(II) oxygenase [Vicinamibacteria bacterium]|nr:2OG-Fe(II) oxygenase [Vicinamibacteria bacterium]
MIDLDAVRHTPLLHSPFAHFVVPRFVRKDAFAPILRDFPEMPHPGSFPLSKLRYGPAFQALVDALQGGDLREVVEKKFDIDLADRPTLITVRGRARAKDGRIHTDTSVKLITVLVYLNEGWTGDGGLLRLLRSSSSLDDFFAEVRPELGTAVFFRCTDNAWHGHTPFVGERRALQLNWVRDASVVRREERRHALSAGVKSWMSLRAVRQERNL